MYESIEPEMLAHPFRVLVPVLPLEQVVQDAEAVEQSVGLLRSRDQLNALPVPASTRSVPRGGECGVPLPADHRH
jgi:hypothetical protein